MEVTLCVDQGNQSSSLQDDQVSDEQSKQRSSDSGVQGHEFITYFNYKIYLQDSSFQINYKKRLADLQSWFQSTEVDCIGIIGPVTVETKVYSARVDSRIERIIIKHVEDFDILNCTKRYKCYLIDTGSSMYLSENQIFHLPEHFANATPLTKPYYLFKVYLDRRFHNKIYRWCNKRLRNKSLTIKSMYSAKFNGQHIEYIKIFDDSSLINQEICDDGLGKIITSGHGKQPKQETVAVPVPKFRTKTFNRSLGKKMGSNSSLRAEQDKCDVRDERGSSSPTPTPSLCAIPLPITIESTYTKSICDRDRLIDSLKGEVRAYKEIVDTQKQNNFSSKLQSASENLKGLVSIRNSLNPLICEESPLIRSITLLLEDLTFHNGIDSATQEGNDLRKMIERATEIPLETIRSFEAQVSSLKLNQRALSLQILQEELQGAMHEMRSSISVLKNLNQDNLNYVTYARIGKELLTWKDQYLKSQSITNEVMEKLTSFLEGSSDFFKRILQGNDEEETPQFQFCESQEISKVFDDEYKDIKKIDLIPTACDSVLRELNLRLLKIKNIDAMLIETLNLDPQLISERSFNTNCPSKEEKEEESYPTLLSFITQSKTMEPRTKYLIVKDIFNGLTKLHETGESYFYLTPSNVFISGGAILCPVDKLGAYEPIPPFKFFAPECRLSIGPCASKSPFKGVGHSADFYSLGQIIIWLASVDASVNFLELMIDLQEKFPILKKLISEDPKHRPATDELRIAIEEIIPDVFGISKEDLLNDDKKENNDFRTSSIESVSSSSFSEDKLAKMIEDEEQLISRELQDTDEEYDDELKLGINSDEECEDEQKLTVNSK